MIYGWFMADLCAFYGWFIHLNPFYGWFMCILLEPRLSNPIWQPLTTQAQRLRRGELQNMSGVCRRGVWGRGVSNLWKRGFQREKRSPEFSRVRTAFAFGWVLSLWKPNFHTLETPRPQTPRLQTPDIIIIIIILLESSSISRGIACGGRRRGLLVFLIIIIQAVVNVPS